MIDRLSLKARHNRAYLYRERMKNLARQKLQQRDFKKDDKSVDNAIKDSFHFKESDQGNQLLNEEIFQDKSLTFTADDLPTVNDVKVVDSVVLENKPSSKTSTKLKDFSQVGFILLVNSINNQLHRSKVNFRNRMNQEFTAIFTTVY